MKNNYANTAWQIMNMILPFCFLLILTVESQAANINSTGSGDWNDPNIWSGSTVPTGSDNVRISDGDKIVIATPTPTVNRLTIEINATLRLSSGVDLEIRDDLTVDGTFEMNHGDINFTGAGKDFVIGQFGDFTWEPGDNSASGASLWINSDESFHQKSSLNIKSWYDYSIPLARDISGNFGNLTINSINGNQIFEWDQNNAFETHEIKGRLKIEQAWIILDQSGSISSTRIGSIELNNTNSYLYFHRGNHSGNVQIETGSILNYYGVLYGIVDGDADLDLQVNDSFENYGEVSLIKNESSPSAGTGDLTFRVNNSFDQVEGDFRGIFNLTNSNAGVYNYQFGSLTIGNGIWIGSYGCHSNNQQNQLRIDDDLIINQSKNSDIFRMVGLSLIAGSLNNSKLYCEIGNNLQINSSMDSEITSCASTGEEQILINGDLISNGGITSFNYGATVAAHATYVTVKGDVLINGGVLLLSRLDAPVTASFQESLLLDNGILTVQTGNSNGSLTIDAAANLNRGDLYLHNDDLNANNAEITLTIKGKFEQTDAKIFLDNNSTSAGKRTLEIKGPVFSLNGQGVITDAGNAESKIIYSRTGNINYFNRSSVDNLQGIVQEIDSLCTLVIAKGVLEVCGNAVSKVCGLTVNGGGTLDLANERAVANGFGNGHLLSVKNNGHLKISNAHGLFNGQSSSAIDGPSGLDYDLAKKSNVTYYGSKTQEVNGFGFAQAELQHHKYGILSIDKPVQAVAMLSGVTTHVRTQLSLASGALDLNNKLLKIISSDSSAIRKDQGYILAYRSRWENNSGVEWKVSSPGHYRIPFASTGGVHIPITLQTVEGQGPIRVLSYPCSDTDNTPLPQAGPNGAITHINDVHGNDFSVRSALDRWYQIEATGIKAKVSLTYLKEEETSQKAEPNTELKIRSWYGNGWSGPFGKAGSNDAESGTVHTGPVENLGTWLICRVPKALGTSVITLDVQPNGNRVDLTWEAPDFEPNTTFSVERSKNGTQYENIGITSKLGRVSGTYAYQFVDESPILGTSYYRVSAVDRTGSTVISSSRQVDMAFERFGLNNVFPMPFQNSFSIELNNDRNEVLEVSIYNMAGQVVAKENYMAQEGKNTILFRNGSDLEAGNYLLVVEGKSTEFSKRIVKAKL